MRFLRYLPLVLLLSSPAAFAKGPAAFAKSDKNADGVIDADEFGGSRQGWGAKLSSKRFLRLDKDQDGAVTPLEFFGEKKLSKLLSSKKKAISEVITGIVSNWAQGDSEAASAWISSLPEPGDTAAWVGAFATQWATSDPAAAAAYLASITTSSDREQALAQIMAAWLAQDQEAAQEWIDSRPPRPEGEEGGGRPGGRPR